MYKLKRIIKNDINVDIREIKSEILNSNHYSLMWCNKKTKEIIFADPKDDTLYRPLVNLKSNYKNVNKRIYKEIIIPELNSFVKGSPIHIVGGIKSKSYTDNIDLHQYNKYRCTIDLQNFYTFTNFKSILRMFEQFGYDQDVATIYSLLCTYIPQGMQNTEDNLILPQGFPTSLAIAYLANRKMIEEIGAYFNDKDFLVSVYVDDVTISSKRPIPQKIIDEVKTIISKNGLKVHNKEKLKSGCLTPIHGVIKYNNKTTNIKEKRARLKEKYDQIKNTKISTFDEYLNKGLPLYNSYMGIFMDIIQIDKNISIPKYHKKMYSKVKFCSINYTIDKKSKKIIPGNENKAKQKYKMAKKMLY